MTRLYTLSEEKLLELKRREHILEHHNAYAAGNIPQEWLEGALITNLEAELPDLDPDKAMDGENAARLHSVLSTLSRLTAADERLWAWMALARYPEYLASRWPFLKDDEEARFKHVRNRWYFGQTPRARSGLGRLWWGAEITGRPKEHNSMFFDSMPDSDPYHYTRILFSRKDYQFDLMERSLSLAPEIIIPALHFLNERDEAGKFVTGPMFRRAIALELRLSSTYRRFEILGFQAVLDVIRDMYTAWEETDYMPDDENQAEDDAMEEILVGSGN